MNDLVSIHRAINRAQDNMGIENDKDVPVLIDWAIEGDKKIGSFHNYTERINVVDINDCKAKLPTATECVVGVLLGDCGCDCGTLFGTSLVTSKSGKITSINQGLIVIDSGSEEVVVSEISYYVQNNHIIFGSNYDGSKATVKTLGYEIDEEGFPMVNENHVEALATYLEYKFMNRQQYRNIGPKFTIGQIQTKARDWNNECADARARDNERSIDQDNEIAAIWNDPLTAFYSSYLLGDPIRNQRYDI